MATRPTTKKSEDPATTAMTTPASGDVPEHATVEFTTMIRGRSVTCRWESGQLSGDQELLDRLARVPVREGWDDDPCTVASAIGAAVAHPVSIRLLDAD